ncbi:Predicted arabinose efflux permease, MFS family [Sanguibacter gelidistatuariae]|uniref:Predicted arabinose efflux permease, MFS family n=1 Tax=Sanguibacter gelidistatuariae TaxID=1814289 RepID=A0A1G6HIV6_9MICO|nr:Predicted arabinose efflux permease, MFS family [Sanguibacter gelidistatuariae]
MSAPSQRSLFATVYLPAAMFGLGQGAAAPVIALTARGLGASLGVAGLVVALAGLGTIIGDLPAGRLVVRLGERGAILLGSAIGVVGVALCLFADTLWLLGAGVVITGLANAVWGLARQSYLTEVIPFARRARAMSTLAGMMRLGFFVGPFLGALAIHAMGARGGFAVQLGAVLLAAVLMARLPDLPGSGPASRSAAAGSSRRVTLGDVIVTHRRLLATLGVGVLLMGLARASRMAVLPLWADHLGVDPVTISLIFGVSAAVDVAVSYPAGLLMDRLGRRAIAVPSLLILAAGYLLLTLATSTPTLGVVALILGVGNGLSNGVIMTLGADVAPAATRAAFFSAWRLMHDGGMFVGPLTVAGIAVLAPLSVAAVTVGAATVLGAAVMWRYIPVYVAWPLLAAPATSAPPAPPAPPAPVEALSKSRTDTAVEVSVTTAAIR